MIVGILSIIGLLVFSYILYIGGKEELNSDCYPFDPIPNRL